LGGGDGWEEFAARERHVGFSLAARRAWGRSDGCEVGL
jgi:hypothetical protein